VKELTEGRGVDYAFEVYGSAETVSMAYDMTRKAGTTVVVGIAPVWDMASIDPVALVRSEKVIKGTYYGSARPRQDMPRIVDLYLKGHIDIEGLITRRYKLEQINQAFDDLERGEVGRGVIVF